MLLAAFALRVIVATVSPSVLWPDEIFQSLEQAHRAAFGPGIVPWEFRTGARSWLLPGLLAGVMKIAGAVSFGSPGYLTAVRSILALASLSVPAVAYFAVRRDFAKPLALAACAMTAGWFELIYFAPKALTEAVAAHALLPGLLLTTLALRPSRVASDRFRLVAGGLLIGVAVAFRMHLAVAALVPLAQVVRTRRVNDVLLFCGAAAVPLLASGMLDAVTWHYPFESYWLNFRANVIDGKSALYGASPWYALASMVGRVWSWGALVLVPFAVLGARRWPGLAASALLLFLMHSALAHKEYRFVYPSIALVIVLASVGMAQAAAYLSKKTASPLVFSAALLATLFAGVSAARASRYDWRDVYLSTNPEPLPLWCHMRGVLLASQVLSNDATVCGVGLLNRRWNRTGGYAYLHRDVPLFEIRSDTAFTRYAGAMNVLLGPQDGPAQVGSFLRERCWDETCLYRRAGECAVVPGYDVNEKLRLVGE